MEAVICEGLHHRDEDQDIFSASYFCHDVQQHVKQQAWPEHGPWCTYLQFPCPEKGSRAAASFHLKGRIVRFPRNIGEIYHYV
ncbi:hypothetical protein GOODEAATRI_029746 [Goodea atripinnis]|uniref:Uncharacterized protein n=1 Tax=Goodea atripinnis TaxID=208336 RepID=A0ABV0P0C2_9TELE